MNTTPATSSQAGTALIRKGNTCNSIAEAIASDGLNIYAAKQNKEQKREMMDVIFSMTIDFLLLMETDVRQAQLIAQAFAEDVMEIRLDWKAEDVAVFFKTVRRRQDLPEFKLMGNKITILKLSEMANAFEALRADEIASRHRTIPQQVQQSKIHDVIAEERLNEMHQRLCDKLKNKEADHNGFIKRAAQTQQWHRENEAEARRLQELYDKGEITDVEYSRKYGEYLLR